METTSTFSSTRKDITSTPVSGVNRISFSCGYLKPPGAIGGRSEDGAACSRLGEEAPPAVVGRSWSQHGQLQQYGCSQLPIGSVGSCGGDGRGQK